MRSAKGTSDFRGGEFRSFDRREWRGRKNHSRQEFNGGNVTDLEASPTLIQLDRHRLRLGVMLQCRLAVLAALAGHLEAAERGVREDLVVAVYPHRPGL